MPEGTQTYFGAMTLTLPDGVVVGLGYTSTRRFAGAFRLRPPASLQVVVDTEGLSLAPGESWPLEDFSMVAKKTRDEALAAIGATLAANHPRLPWKTPPTGWCSWYCFGPRVTAQNILDNLDAIEKRIPGLTYVQIDDGYQPAMGDWLETGPAFGGDIRKVLDAIKRRGFQPAIWVAPFVAEQDSHVFQQHPDWFVKDAAGTPLRSDKVTFGGWRRGPWYVLDGTHAEVQAHLAQVFRTMNREWGVTYFKLDANFWGAIHGGRFHDAQATRVEAYRRGMQAILNGAGDSFILGCNHPIWPSAGLIHGSRSSNDIKRDWNRIRTTAQQNLLRNWQNGLLWWNDPDAVCLAGDLPEHEFVYHATAIYATGGMVLSGDDLSAIPAARLAMLKQLLPPTGVPAVFDADALTVGRVTLPGRQMLCLFNPNDSALDLRVPLAGRPQVRDVWTGESLGPQRALTLALPPRSARLLECRRG
jgi:alpha-galactosidase